MSVIRSKRVLAVLAAIGTIAVAATAAHADGFYQGKQGRLFTMGSPGGGYDAHMRTLIPYLERKTGAKFIPVNETGAGGLIAMNRTITATPDGLTILLTGGEGVVTAQLYGLPGVRYDARKLVYLARVSGEAKVMLMGAKSPFKTIADMLKSDRAVIWAASGKTDGNADFAAIVGHALGIKTKIIPGYKGSGGMNLAIENGEVDGRVVSEEAAALFVHGGKMHVIATLARERSDQFPNAPTVFEAAKPSPAQARWIDWRAGVAALGRLLITTPGTPHARVAYLRGVMKEILTDPDFVAAVKKRRLTVGYESGAEVARHVAAAMDTLDAKQIVEVKDVALKRYYAQR
jgi:tripartite-type tricarboxylate transporter receptor subunit TctC